MPVEPQVFLSYGRPDKELALRLSRELWRHRIECYNYLAKPFMDRLGSNGDHLKYIFASRFLIAIVSAETHWRELVMEELITAYRLTNDKLRDIPTVYVTTPQILRSGPYPHSNSQHLIDPTSSSGGPAAIADELVRLMGDELVQHCQKAWDINKTLYPDHWRRLDAALRAGDAGRDVLPEVPEVVAAALKGVSVTEYMLGDLRNISSETNQSVLLALLSSLWQRIDNVDARVLDTHVPAGVRAASVPGLITEVPPKAYAADETIVDVSAVLRGAARIVNAVNQMRCAEAFDIARRYQWPATRQALLCAIYAAAAEMGDDGTRRNICRELGIAGVATPQARPSFMAKISRMFRR